MINWDEVDTVLLDMDGTLLDLTFDNYFWQEFVPINFAKRHDLTLEQAKQQLVPRFKQMEGQLEWYCLDYWSKVLNLDIAGLKQELAELIKVLPHVTEFLQKIHQSHRKVMLVTNAHRDSLGIKMAKTNLNRFFDALISSHDIGFAKEQDEFWPRFHSKHPFLKKRTLFIDDNVAVLGAAQQFGIQHLISVSKPELDKPAKVIQHYPAIEDFRALMVGL